MLYAARFDAYTLFQKIGGSRSTKRSLLHKKLTATSLGNGELIELFFLYFRGIP